jgi:hypothetical protein
MPRLDRGIAIAAASRFYFRGFAIPGRPVKPGDDDAGNEKGGE